MRSALESVALNVKPNLIDLYCDCCIPQRWSRGHKARGQGQGHRKISRPRPRTDPLKAKVKDQGHRRKCSQKKRSSKIFFKRFQKKRSSKFFFRRSLLEETKKRSLKIFRKVSGVFQQNFNGSKIVLSWSRGQSNFRGLEDSRPRPRTSKYVLEDALEAKDVLEDSISGIDGLHVTSSRCKPNRWTSKSRIGSM